MAVNKTIVTGAIGITAVGIVSAIGKGKPITPVVIGGYVVCLLASVLDLVGGQTSTVAGLIVMAAFFGVLLTEFPWEILNVGTGEDKGGKSFGPPKK